jgi:ribosomal subunit interface protein
MRVTITMRHCDVADTVRERAETLVEKLVKYDPRVSAAELVFGEERHERRVEAVLSVDGDEPAVASGVGDDFTAAVDQLVDRLGKILRRRRSQVRVHHAGPVSEGLTSA